MRGKLTQEMTDSQKRLIDEGKATALPLIIECIVFDYHEDERWDIDITATLPNVGDSHPSFTAGDETYYAFNGQLYKQKQYFAEIKKRRVRDSTINVVRNSTSVWEEGAYEGARKNYKDYYSNSIVINGRVAIPVERPLYARLWRGAITVTEYLDTTLVKDGDTETYINDPSVASWRVPLAYAHKLRYTYLIYLLEHNVTRTFSDETANIPFDNEVVAAALEANATEAKRGVDAGVYLPTVEEMGAAHALEKILDDSADSYIRSKLSNTRRIADALAAYEETCKGATILWQNIPQDANII